MFDIQRLLNIINYYMWSHLGLNQGLPDYEVLLLRLYTAGLQIYNKLYSAMYKVMYKVYFFFFLGSCACKSATSNSNSLTLASALLHRA